MYLFLSRMYLAISFINKFIDWALHFTFKTQCDEKRWVYRDPEPNSFMSLYQQKTDVKILNVKVVRVHWVHLLCNNFDSLPSSSSAIITAWVIRQSSNNEKLEKQKKTCISVVNHEMFSLHCSVSDHPVVLLQKWSDLQKSPKIVNTI